MWHVGVCVDIDIACVDCASCREVSLPFGNVQVVLAASACARRMKGIGTKGCAVIHC